MAYAPVISVWTGTIRANLGTACLDIQTKLAGTTLGTWRDGGVKAIGPGKYFQAYLIYE